MVTPFLARISANFCAYSSCFSALRGSMTVAPGTLISLGIAQDDDVGQAFLDDLVGRDDGARILALGQDDGLKVGLGGRLHTV